MSDTKHAIKSFLGSGFTIAFPYNHDPDLWLRTEPYHAVINEFYADFHPTVFPSFRPWKQAFSAQEHQQNLERLLGKSSAKGIALNIALNTVPTRGYDAKVLFESIRRLSGCGQLRIAVTDISVGERLREAFPDLSIGVSTVAEVSSQAEAKTWIDRIGVDSVVVNENINKRPERIREIHDLGITVKLIPIGLCTPECPIRHWHYKVLGSQENETEGVREDSRVIRKCREIKRDLPPWHWAKKEVLPAHLPRYAGIVDVFKLIDRNLPTDINLQTLERTIRMKDDVHPVYGYREPAEALGRLASCDRVCAACSWCADNIEQVFEPDLSGERHENVFLGDGPAGAEEGEFAPENLELRDAQRIRWFDLDNPMEALNKLRVEIGDSGNGHLLPLYARLIKQFRNLLIDKTAIGTGYRASRIRQFNREGFAVELLNKGHLVTIVILSPEVQSPVAIRAGWCGILVQTETDDSDSIPSFSQIENSLRQMI